MCVASSRCSDDLCRRWLGPARKSRVLHGNWMTGASRSAAETVCAFAATCLTAPPRSQQELRPKPTTLRTQNQRGQLARVQIVVVDRRTPSALRKERPAALADLSTRSATRCQQGFSQLRVSGSEINNGALRRHAAPLCKAPGARRRGCLSAHAERMHVSGRLSTTSVDC